MNEEYWNKYYENRPRLAPSDFAIWAKPRIRGSLVWDIGAGNGRDTGYLGAVAVDPHAPPQHYRQKVEDFMEDEPCYPVDTVYARWFLHAVEQEVEDRLLDWCKGQLLVEARVEGDTLDNSHTRRPLNPDRFLRKLLGLGYEISYFEVARGFSKVGSDDPLLLRVDASCG